VSSRLTVDIVAPVCARLIVRPALKEVVVVINTDTARGVDTVLLTLLLRGYCKV